MRRVHDDESEAEVSQGLNSALSIPARGEPGGGAELDADRQVGPAASDGRQFVAVGFPRGEPLGVLQEHGAQLPCCTQGSQRQFKAAPGLFDGIGFQMGRVDVALAGELGLNGVAQIRPQRLGPGGMARSVASRP